MPKKSNHGEGEEMLQKLRDLVRLAQAGDCTAVRVFSSDGAYQDMVCGGSQEDQAMALERLRKAGLH